MSDPVSDRGPRPVRIRPPVVAQTDISRLAGYACAPLPVGVVPWEIDRTSVVMRVTYRYPPMELRPRLQLLPEQPGFTKARPSSRHGASDVELLWPHDLEPVKLGTDVIVVGNAYAPQSQERIDARLHIAERLTRSFCAVGTRDDHLPLTAHFLRDDDGHSPTPPVGPCGPFDVRTPTNDEERRARRAASAAHHQALWDKIKKGEWDPTAPKPVRTFVADPEMIDNPPESVPLTNEELEAAEQENFDSEARGWDDLVDTGEPFLVRGRQFAAAASVTRSFVEPEDVLELDGLGIGGERRLLQIPPHEPAVIYEAEDVAYDLRAVCDTLILDNVACTLTMVWRAQIGLDALATPGHRLIVSMEDVNNGRMLQELDRDLQRGHYARAVTEAEVDIPADVEDHEVIAARYKSFDLTPDPALPLERYATVSAELSLKREARAAVLEKHGLNEMTWLLEERAWLERVANAMSRGDLDTPVKITDAVRAARDALEAANQ